MARMGPAAVGGAAFTGAPPWGEWGRGGRRHRATTPAACTGSFGDTRCAKTQGETMPRLTVLYGHPRDPAAFDRYYHDVHIPIARRMTGLAGWTIGKCESATPGEKPPYYMIVGLY